MESECFKLLQKQHEELWLELTQALYEMNISRIQILAQKIKEVENSLRNLVSIHSLLNLK